MFSIDYLASLFDKETITKIKIVYLLKEKKTWLSIDELSSQLGINQRTILKYLAFIEEDISAFSMNADICLEKHERKGFFLSYDFDPTLSDLVFFMIEQTINYKLLMDIFFGKIHSIIQFSHNFYVSESSLWRMINKFRKKLLPMGIAIERRSLNLLGNEIQIRKLSYFLLVNSYAKGYWPYTSTTKLLTERLVKKIIDFFHLCLSDYEYMKVFCMVAVCIERTKQEKHVILTKELSENIDNNELFTRFANELRDVLPKQAHRRDEVGFLFLYIFTRDEAFNDTYIRKLFLNFHQEKNTQLSQSVHTLKDHLSLNHNFIVPKDELQLINKCLYSAHLYCQLFQNREQSASAESMFQFNTMVSPHLIMKTKELIHLLYHETGFSLFKETDYLLSIYPLLFEVITPIPKMEEPLRIFFVSDLSNLEEHRLINRIKTEFLGHINLEIYTHHDCLIDFQTIDLVLSTKRTITNGYSKIPNVAIPKEPSKLDFYNLETKLHKMYVQREQPKELISL
ncbi:helix-turn-helix domain-containing protein [Enterococcus sp. AZ163]|uniref:helix-turn-helix domain-containing protein n=1 Tax=Enterococcus sp. AZ163 TaxID=2774638 RepID=UPI003D267D3F